MELKGGFRLRAVSILIGALIGLATPSIALAQGPALLLFDGETGKDFAGCLNCGRFDPASVCNRYGDYGSRYSDKSIWNRFGSYGSKYEQNSPWNRYGQGLRIVDKDGNYYGQFARASVDRSRLPIVAALIAAYEENDDLSDLRDRLCES